MHEALPSCAGQIVPPVDYFAALYDIIHAHGGCCIADEVQTGIGRVGSKFWSFELYNIMPDIVTIGKPLGNGHPVAAVITSEEVAQSFDTGMEFFSSFGGNPVSCAIANAVLDVMERENLKEHAHKTGAYWMRSLKDLAANQPVVHNVRGHGLFIGIDLRLPDNTPATAIAAYIERRMFEHRILLSLDGPGSNVIKIKPPMCITQSQVDYFLEIFAKVLDEDFVARLGV